MRISITKHFASMKDSPSSVKNTVDITFYLTFSRVFENILQNLTLAEWGKCAMVFTRQNHFTLALASRRALVSIPGISVIYCSKFLMLSNQTSVYICMCIRMKIICTSFILLHILNEIQGSIPLKRIGTRSGTAVLSFLFCHPSQEESARKGKNLLL